MMARISIDDARAWVEDSKLKPDALDLDHLSQIEEEIFARINSVYDVSTWLDKPSTPRLIQVIISKYYAGYLYDKFYSENQSLPNNYSQLIKQNAEMLVTGIIDGTITIPGLPPTNQSTATFYPNDASSAIAPDSWDYSTFKETGLLTPIPGDTSTGPSKFSMGRVF